MSIRARLARRRRPADPPDASTDPAATDAAATDADTADADTADADTADADMADGDTAAPNPGRSRTQRLYLALFATIAGLFVVSLLWIVVTGLIARAQLDSVKHELSSLRSAVAHGDLTTARQMSARITDQTGSAHQLTSGPAWWVGSNIPGLGTPLRTGRIVAYQADLIGHRALPGIIDLANELGSASDGTSGIDLARLAQAGQRISSTAATVSTAHQVIASSAPSWLPLVSGPRHEVVTELASLDTQTARADDAVRIALPMLGAHGTQRYFLGFLNEAESRGLGGLPGAFAIVEVTNGHPRFTHFGSDVDLLHTQADITMPAYFNALYGQDNPTGDIRNSDVSPNFPDAARIWAAMWQKKTGQRVDGAIAVDPSAIAFLLRVTGPATLPDGSTVSADNVVSLTQERQYDLYGSDSAADTVKRKAYLDGIAGAVANRILTTPRVRALAGPARTAIEQRRLVLWSADPSRESIITELGIGGVLDPSAGDPFSAFFVNNAAGGKMDLYLDRHTTYTRSTCSATTATAVLTLHNDTPAYALPSYVTTVLADKPAGAKPGFNRLIVAYYATPGATISRVTLDGKLVSVTKALEAGLPSARLAVDLPANATRTIQVTISEPKATGNPTIVRQPGVRDIRVATHAPDCS